MPTRTISVTMPDKDRGRQIGMYFLALAEDRIDDVAPACCRAPRIVQQQQQATQMKAAEPPVQEVVPECEGNVLLISRYHPKTPVNAQASAFDFDCIQDSTDKMPQSKRHIQVPRACIAKSLYAYLIRWQGVRTSSSRSALMRSWRRCRPGASDVRVIARGVSSAWQACPTSFIRARHTTSSTRPRSWPRHGPPD